GLDFSTPAIDRMAQEGMRFSRAYTSPVCTPSRVSLHTGQYTFDHGEDDVLPVHLGTKETFEFSERPSFAQLLREDGYVTSVTGKWQLATLYEHPDHPYRSGFDSWCLWQIWDGEKRQKRKRYYEPWLNRDGYVMNGEELELDLRLPAGEVLPAGTLLPDAMGEFGPDVLHRYVKERMQSAVSEEKPFFILHNMVLPHRPLVAPPGGEETLASMIEYLDGHVGDLLDEIERLGIREETYVFFIGDNGTQSREERLTRDGPVKGGKWSLTDGGTHVPFIVWGPESVAKGFVCDDLVDITDVFPTVCELAQVEVPEDIQLRGYSLVPEIQGEPSAGRRTWVHGGIAGAQALFDGEWRLVYNDGAYRLVDCRELPVEVVCKEPYSQEEAAAMHRLRGIFEELNAVGK
ncbi:MAG: sulfatase-like hydrolase/transferase, partial [Puniceicoccales bacterium]